MKRPRQGPTPKSAAAAEIGGTRDWPRITIVTPSYNQGRFLEATIQSVLSQNYPNLQFIIIDGGSTDGSVEIIERYANSIDHWVSESDEGQSHAIEKGLALATGDLFNWLNSDDQLAQGALSAVAACWLRTGERPHLVLGRCVSVDGANHVLTDWRPRVPRGARDFMLGTVVMPQPSSFIATQALVDAGGVRRDLHYVMDWELYLRLSMRFGRALRASTTDVLLSRALQHHAAKATQHPERFWGEIRRVVLDYMPRFSFGDRLWAARWIRRGDMRELVTRSIRSGDGDIRPLLGIPLRFPGAIGSRFFWGGVRRVLGHRAGKQARVP